MTTPLVLLSVTPAFADAEPTTQEQSSRPSIKQLLAAAAEAEKAYEAAVKAALDAADAFKALSTEASPLYVARQATAKQAAEAAAAKAAADTAVTKAKDALAALPGTATEEEKAAATKAVTEAEAVAKTAAETKTAADAKATAAQTALDDARVAAAQKIDTAQKAKKSAFAVKEAADKALAEALEEEEEGNEGDGEGDCVPEPDLTAVVTGLPGTVVAGDWVNLKLRVTNGTAKTMDEVRVEAGTHATDNSGLKDIGHLLKLQWSSAASKTWQNVDVENYIDAFGPLKKGAHSDIKLRLKVDAKAPAGQGMAYVVGSYRNDDESCGGMADLNMYEFKIAKAGSKPGKVPPAKPSTAPKPPVSAPSPQGSSSAQPVSGSLAQTGADSAVPQIALAGAAAVVVGAGAVFVVRRRKSDSAV
ncbi:MAG TPA: LAETG motif-containing sortase-dependent surface protein [Streptomyces sp.]|nr:LAETG motif-containing sortase-dependent surface protein [Streptomyces sp.]